MIKKVKTVLIIAVLCLTLMAGCSSKAKILDGKYICVDYMSELYKGHEIYYYIFSKDKTYTTNNPGEDYDGVPFPDYGTYSIEDDELTLFAGDDPEEPEITYTMGYIYKNMICSKWDGELPLELQEKKIFLNLSNILFIEINFTEEGYYEHTVTGENGEIFETTTGTYEVNKNKVECKNEEGLITTFYDTDDGVYGVDYIKE